MVAFVRYADRAGLRAPVPTCPDWTVRDLVAHQGMVHRWAAALLRGEADIDPDALRGRGPRRAGSAGVAARGGARPRRDDHPGAGRRTRPGVPQRRARAARVLGAPAVPRDDDARRRRAVRGAGPAPRPDRGVDRDRPRGRRHRRAAGRVPDPTALASCAARSRACSSWRPTTPRTGGWSSSSPGPAVTTRRTGPREDGDWVLAGTAVDLYLSLWNRTVARGPRRHLAGAGRGHLVLKPGTRRDGRAS